MTTATPNATNVTGLGYINMTISAIMANNVDISALLSTFVVVDEDIFCIQHT